jgi:hypothetical protein
MATTVTPGVNCLTVSVDLPPGRPDLVGLYIWCSTVSGFTPSGTAAGTGNCVYAGPDLQVVLAGLPANVTQYLKMAYISNIDRSGYTASAQFSATPTGAAAADLVVGNIRGSSMFAAAYATKGSVLNAANGAGAATLTLRDTTDFNSGGGTAVVFSATLARDRNTITYTGKTATTLTGVSGATAHSAGEVIIPLTKAIVLDQNVGEMRFYSDRGDGTIEEMANIGQVSTAPSGTIVDDAIVALGSYHSSFDKLPLHIRASKSYGIYAHRQGSPSGNQPVGFFLSSGNTGGPALWAQIDGTNNTYAMFAMTGSAGTAIRGQATSGTANGVDGQASGSGFGVKGRSATGVGVWAESTGSGVPLHIVPDVAPSSASVAKGSFYVNSSGRLSVHDGSAFRFLLRESDVIKAAAGTVAAPGLTFGTDTNTGLYSKSANVIGFTTNGTEAGYVDASGNWNFTKNIGVGSADPSGSATINAGATIGGNATRYGINNALVVDGSETLTAGRSYFGSRSIARSTIGITPKNGQTVSLYGSYSLATVAETAGGTGNADTVYGAYNYGLVWSATNAVVDSVYGTYSFAQNSTDSLMRVDHLRGMFAWARQSTAENGVAIYGSEAIVQVDDGSFTDGYIYKGSMSVSAPGSVPNKWGFYLTGCAKSYIDGTFEAGGAVTAGGNIQTSNGLIGYATGAGSTVTQLTSKATGVTINASCGLITTFNGQLNAGATVSFTVTNNLVTAADTVIIHRRSGGTPGAYEIWPDGVTNGSFTVYIRNRTAGNLAEAININFGLVNVVNA